MSEDYSADLILPNGTELDWAAGRQVLESLTTERYLVLNSLSICNPPDNKRMNMDVDELLGEVAQYAPEHFNQKKLLKMWDKFQKIIETIDRGEIPKHVPEELGGNEGGPYKVEKAGKKVYVIPQGVSSEGLLRMYHACGAFKASGFDAPISAAFSDRVTETLTRLEQGLGQTGPEL